MKKYLLVVGIFFNLNACLLARHIGVLSYEIIDAMVVITDCDVSAVGDLIIPETIEGIPVTRIGDEAFKSCFNLTSIAIPDSVVTIGDHAFYECSKLTNVLLGVSVENIGSFMFHGCISLTNIDVDLNNTFFSSRNGVLLNSEVSTLIEYPKAKAGNYIIPDNVTTILENAFYKCLNLESVKLPDSVVSIGDYAFYDCDELSIVTMGNSLTSIGSWSFALCSNLKSISMPDSLINIGDQAFRECTKLKSINIPNNVTVISTAAFYRCYQLSRVNIGTSVYKIESSAFTSCWAMNNITIPSNVTIIENGAFEDCSFMKSVIFNGDAPETSYLSSFYRFTAVYYYVGGEGFSSPMWQGYTCIELTLDSDNDDDGIPNGYERLLSTSPLDGNSKLRTWLSNEAGIFKLYYSPHSEDFVFSVEVSNDLANSTGWDPVTGLNFTGNDQEQFTELGSSETIPTFYRIRLNLMEEP